MVRTFPGFAQIFLVLGVLCFAGCQTVQSGAGSEGEDILLGEVPALENMRVFKNLAASEPGTAAFENARIEYLFERLKQSRYNFIRNGKTYSTARAVAHLKWKYLRVKKDISTAEDFVEKIASGSRKSGDPYLVRIAEGQTYPLKLVFQSELKRLDQVWALYLKKIKNGVAETTQANEVSGGGT